MHTYLSDSSNVNVVKFNEVMFIDESCFFDIIFLQLLTMFVDMSPCFQVEKKIVCEYLINCRDFFRFQHFKLRMTFRIFVCDHIFFQCQRLLGELSNVWEMSVVHLLLSAILCSWFFISSIYTVLRGSSYKWFKWLVLVSYLYDF